jgi:hypothetical protein
MNDLDFCEWYNKSRLKLELTSLILTIILLFLIIYSIIILHIKFELNTEINQLIKLFYFKLLNILTIFFKNLFTKTIQLIDYYLQTGSN